MNSEAARTHSKFLSARVDLGSSFRNTRARAIVRLGSRFQTPTPSMPGLNSMRESTNHVANNLDGLVII